MPCNPYTKVAQTFTSAIPIKRTIQRRQLRSQHEDDHYCASLFNSIKDKFIEMGPEAILFCCDDKSKIKIEEPGAPILTGVRGKSSIAPSSTTLVAVDHDIGKGSLTPSVVLNVKLKENPSANDSFVRGKVTTSINDSVFQPSCPFRHAAMLAKILEKEEQIPSVLFKYTDGGTDQRNTLEAVKCANICLFFEFQFEMVIAARCAPGQSYKNPAERVMSILNIGLQNSATEGTEMDETAESLLKKCNSCASIRDRQKSHQDLKDKWQESIRPVQENIGARFKRLTLKDEPISVISPVSEHDIENMKRHLSFFPTLDQSKLQKQHTQKCVEYVEWKQKHCYEGSRTTRTQNQLVSEIFGELVPETRFPIG